MRHNTDQLLRGLNAFEPILLELFVCGTGLCKSLLLLLRGLLATG